MKEKTTEYDRKLIGENILQDTKNRETLLLYRLDGRNDKQGLDLWSTRPWLVAVRKSLHCTNQ